MQERWDALELDSLGLVETWFRRMSALVPASGDHDHGVQFGALEPEEIVGLPGAQEVLALHRLAALSRSGEYDLIVVDCPGAADALRTLAAPSMVADYLERVWPQHRRMIALTGSDPRLVLLVSALERLTAAMEEIRSLLADRAHTSVRVVTTPEGVVLAQTRRILAVAALSALRVDAVLVNNVSAQEDSDEARTGGGGRFTDLADAACGAAVLSVPRMACEPVGLSDLSRIASLLYAEEVDAVSVLGADSPPVRVTHESGSGSESVYAMRMHLPLVDPATLTLGRVEDDLVVGAEGARRRVRLASVLRRCVVAGAELDGTDLVVRFTPDPRVWPR
ncbi:arsenite-transporting ATPase [Rhodococcus triatomae]|uniref:Arsenite-transporting ATPase n=1 Tax=Rhodococcus triatomae TaxID=300028 RepID=A0A1G8D4M9_9NOCA|nr:arsenite-transporting ATPase [Rhodococcus triatomae]